MAVKRVLAVASNVGLWAEELQAPWDALRGAGHECTLATPLGLTPLSLVVSLDATFLDPKQNYAVNPPEVCARVRQIYAAGEWDHPIKIHDADLADYDAIVVAGGLGAPLDLANHPALRRLLLAAFRSNKLIGSICYATAALLFTRDPDRGYRSIVWGKRITAHPRNWDFDADLWFPLEGTTGDNHGTDLIAPAFAFPLQDLITDGVGPDGECIAIETANRQQPSVVFDWPFVTATSVESSIAFGEKLVEALATVPTGVAP